MPRIRTIKPEFPQSESMGRVSRDARLLFVQMWTLADDSGRLRGNSRMLASLLFPYDNDAPDLISHWLDELEAEGCIVRYVAADGRNNHSHYVAICNWREHQKIDKPSESKLPSPDDGEILEHSRSLANIREPSIPSRARADRDQGPGPGTKDLDLGPGSVGIDEASTPTVRKQSSVQRNPPSVDEVRCYMADQGYLDDADAFVDFYAANGWVQGRGKPIRDWQAAVRNWQRNDYGKTSGASPPVTFAQQRLANTRAAAREFLEAEV